MNYNIDYSNIAKALRDGISQEDIAKTFAAALNQASAEIKAEKAKAEEAKRLAEKAKREQEALEAKKLQHAQLVADFYNTYYPEMFPDDGKGKATAETIIKACETVKKIATIPVNMPKFSEAGPFSGIFRL